MIKFFRRIRRRLIEKGKLKNYLIYAIGEIILIIIGVLLAVQINMLFQEENDKKREKLLLQEIHEEFVDNRKQLDAIMNLNQERYDLCSEIIELFPIDIKTDNYSIVSKIMKTVGRNTFNPTQGTIDALIGTSSIEIISNQNLRQLLIQWNGEISDYKEQEHNVINHLDNHYSLFVTKSFPFPPSIEEPLNLKDSRMKLSVLESYEFENHIIARRGKLISLIKGSENMDSISEAIDKILELTAEYD